MIPYKAAFVLFVCTILTWHLALKIGKHSLFYTVVVKGLHTGWLCQFLQFFDSPPWAENRNVYSLQQCGFYWSYVTVCRSTRGNFLVKYSVVAVKWIQIYVVCLFVTKKEKETKKISWNHNVGHTKWRLVWRVFTKFGSYFGPQWSWFGRQY